MRGRSLSARLHGTSWNQGARSPIGVGDRLRGQETSFPRTRESLVSLFPGRQRSGLPESHVVHFADNLKPGIRVEGKPSLMKKPIRSSASRLACGVKTDTRFSYPDQQAANACRKRHRRVGDARPRLQHQTRDPTDGNVRATPLRSTTTNAPSSTSSRPFSMNRIEVRSFTGIGRGGAIPGVAATVVGLFITHLASPSPDIRKAIIFLGGGTGCENLSPSPQKVSTAGADAFTETLFCA